MRSITLWMAAVTIVAVVLSAGAVRHALAGEPATPSSAAEATGGAAGKETGGSDAAPPAAEGQPSPPAEATDIQERGLLPGLVVPSGTLQSIQSIAPTPSLNAIVKAIQVTSKSVSVNLRIPRNLTGVTVPVEVSVAYISPAQAQRLTKTYSEMTRRGQFLTLHRSNV